jgi:menaquinone-dependent protoporphyrinogen oxidase
LRVLVAHASVHGSTAEIAERIADRLREDGLDVDVRPVDEVAALSGYAAVVVGSAIHTSNWLFVGRSFIRSHAEALHAIPTWMFSVSAVGATSSAYGSLGTTLLRTLRRAPTEIHEARKTISPVDHRQFAGVVAPEGWSKGSIRLFKLFGGTFGDHRDWDDVDQWAAGIGRALTSGEANRR